MDFLKVFPEEVYDEILSYFSINDIKKASLVSKHWYETIGKSKICMDNICLRVREFLQFYEDILNSTRFYQHLVILIDQDRVEMNNKYLRIMRSIVEKFKGSLVSIKKTRDLRLDVDLLKLKKLEFKGFYTFSKVPLFVSNGLITKAKNLEELNIDYLYMDESIEYFKAALMANSSLKVLRVTDNRILQGLNADNLKFRLEEFHTKENVFMPELSNIHHFLDAHFLSLKVGMCHFTRDNVAYFMSKFPQLHTLIIKRYYSSALGNDTLNYSLNLSIKALALYVCYFNDLDEAHVIAIISKLPNLQKVELIYLNQKLIKVLSSCQSLKTIICRSHVMKVSQNIDETKRYHEIMQFVKPKTSDQRVCYLLFHKTSKRTMSA